MSHSLNEIAAHAKRASRGAGLSWGLAEEAARAARWLASHGLKGPALLSDVLQKNDGVPHAQIAPASLGGEWRAPKGDLCPLTAGAALNDCADRLADGRPIKMTGVSCPLLILPFAAWAAIHLKHSVRVIWQDVWIDTDGEGIWFEDPHSQINAGRTTALTCQLAGKHKEPAKRPGTRGTVTPEIWAQLAVFGQRTFAPATDASRLLGAGAGVSDND